MKSSSPPAPKNKKPAKNAKSALTNKRRQHLRRRALRFFATIGLFAALVALWVMPLWRFTGEVIIKGNRWVSSDTLRQGIAVPPVPLFRIDPKQLKSQIEVIPQVEHVEVRRWLFPARLEVRIKERTPVAQVASQSMYLDSNGVLFSAPKQPTPITVLLPEPYRQDTSELFRTFIREWPPSTRGLLDLRRQDDIRVSLGGLTARFGTSEETSEKFKAFFRLRPLAKRYGEALEYLDLRFPNSPTLKCKATSPPCNEIGNSP